MVTWVTWVHGSVGAWVSGSNFYVGCMVYMGQNMFSVGQHVTWVLIFKWVAWVTYIFAWVNFFTWVKIFCVS